MARLYEYQGKQLLKEAGVSIPKGRLASTPQEAVEAAKDIGKPVAVKAQVWTTGRFKAGGIKFAETPEEAEQAARELLGSAVKGFRVERVLVEEKLNIAKEFYASVIIDGSYKVRAPVVIFSSEGGVDIEEVAQRAPECIARQTVDILQGFDASSAQALVSTAGVRDGLLDPLAATVAGLYQVFHRYDARSAEINPLVLTTEGRIVAADCRISVDDASVGRHPELGIVVPRESDTPPTELDRVGWKIEESDYRGVSFFAQMASDTSQGGYIGYHAIGGGGALLAADMLVRHGLKLANYAESSGNPTAAKVYRTASVILAQPGLEGYCLLGAVIASQEQWHHAHGLVKAFREILVDRPGFPVVILIAGNKEEESLQILREGLAGLPIRLEIYGREYIHRLAFVVERTKVLAEEYRAENPGIVPYVQRQVRRPEHSWGFDFRTGSVIVDQDRCAGCQSLACVKACSLYGGSLLVSQNRQPTLGIPLERVSRQCSECLACEYECRLRGQGALQILLPIEGLERA